MIRFISLASGGNVPSFAKCREIMGEGGKQGGGRGAGVLPGGKAALGPFSRGLLSLFWGCEP